jgi:ankyrin repeat protein
VNGVLDVLSVHASNPHAPEVEGGTPLHVAAAMADLRTVNFLLGKGADPNALDVNHRTPLFNACKSGNLEVIAPLLAAGSDPTIGANNGAEPLYVAAQIGHLEVVKLLLRTPGVLVDCRGCGCPPLHIAVLFSHKAVVKELLAAGADVNSVAGEASNSALAIACQKGNEEIIDILVKGGADVFHKNLVGGTPLHMASWFGFKETIKTLLGYGADPFQADGRGKLPVDYAEEGATLGRNPNAEKCQRYLNKKMEEMKKSGGGKARKSAADRSDSMASIDEVIAEVVGTKLDATTTAATQPAAPEAAAKGTTKLSRMT